MTFDPDRFHEFEHAGWEKAAGGYEVFWAGLTSQFVTPLLATVGATRGTRLLDVACGPGHLSEAASRLGALTLGVDFSPTMVARARRRHAGLAFLEADARDLPCRPGVFDAVVVNFGLLHIADPERACAEAFRVLRAGGKYAFTIWAKPGENMAARIMDGAIGAHGDPTVGPPDGPPHYRFSDPGECRKVLEEAGFAGPSFTFETVAVKWVVPTASFLFEAERDGGVRTAAVLARQSPGHLAAIRSAVERSVREFATDGGYAIPMVGHIVAAAAGGRR